MTNEGPLLPHLLHRLQTTPPEFLDEPRILDKGNIAARAVVADLCRAISADEMLRMDTSPFIASSGRERNRMRVILIASWLLYDQWFRKPDLLGAIQILLKQGLTAISEIVEADQFVSDPDRREELVRYILSQLQLRPQGETVAQAQDRLLTLDSLEQQRVMKASMEAEERARKIREEIKRKLEEEEAAAKAYRE